MTRIYLAKSEYDAYMQAKEDGFAVYACRLIRGNFYKAYDFDAYLSALNAGTISTCFC